MATKAERQQLEDLLDGDLSSYSLYRWSVALLLGGGWFYAAETYLEVFITHPVSVHDCACAAPIDMLNLTLADACTACALHGAALACAGDGTTIATSFALYCEADWLRTSRVRSCPGRM